MNTKVSKKEVEHSVFEKKKKENCKETTTMKVEHTLIRWQMYHV